MWSSTYGSASFGDASLGDASLWDAPPILNLFDSYGNDYNTLIYKYSTAMLNDGINNEPFLPNLISKFLNEGGTLKQNSIPFQKGDIDTCGRHCILRMKMSYMDNAKYKDYLDQALKFTRGLSTYDDIVTLLTWIV
jgi:hypothetical protein